MKIGIFGSSSNDIKETIRISARRMGAEIARTGNILITGACSGIPHEAVLAAHEVGGRTIGYSPGTDLAEHVRTFNYPAEGFSQLIFVPMHFENKNNPSLSTKYRSINAISECDVVVIIGGKTGTLAEFAIAYDSGKTIGILEGSGGITERTIDTFLEDIEMKIGAKIFRDSDPIALLRKLIEVDEQDKHITF